MLAVVTTVVHVFCIVCMLAALLKVKKTRLRHLPARRTRVSRHHGESTLWLERLVNALVDMFFYGAQVSATPEADENDTDASVNGTTCDTRSRVRIGGCVLTFFDLWKLGRDRAGMNDEAREADWLRHQPRNPLLATLEERVGAYLEDSGLATWAEFQIRSLGERPPRVRIVHVASGSGATALASQPTVVPPQPASHGGRGGSSSSSGSNNDNKGSEATKADIGPSLGGSEQIASATHAPNGDTPFAAHGTSGLPSLALGTGTVARTEIQHKVSQSSSLSPSTTSRRDDVLAQSGYAGSVDDDSRPTTAADSRRRRVLRAWWARLQPRLPWLHKTFTAATSASGQSIDTQRGAVDTATPVTETARLAANIAPLPLAAATSPYVTTPVPRPLSRPPATTASEGRSALVGAAPLGTAASRGNAATPRPVALPAPATRLEVEAELEYSGSLDIALRAELALMRGRRLPLYIRVGEVKYVRVHVCATVDLPHGEAEDAEAAAMGIRTTAAATTTVLSSSAPASAALECNVWLMSDPAFDLQLHTTFSRLAITDFFLIPLIAKCALLRLVHARLRRTRSDGLHVRIPLPPGLLPQKMAAAAAAAPADATMASTPLESVMHTP